MEYRQVGSSGLRVSAVSIGGWLTFGGSIDQETTGAILRAAIDSGVNFVDLADVYARGEAESAVGRCLGDYERSSLVISSKVFWPMGDGPNDRGLSRKHIHEGVEKSLRRLNTDYLDILFCHREDPETPLEETVTAMEDLIRQGKILYWGTSVWGADSLKDAHRIAERRSAYAPIVEQPRYNLIHRDIEKKVLPMANRLGMGLVVWSPLAGGILTGKYNYGVPEGSRGDRTDWLSEDLTETNLDRTRRFCEIAADMDVKPAALALAWILRRSEVASVITGATSAVQFDANLAGLEVTLNDDMAWQLEKLFP